MLTLTLSMTLAGDWDHSPLGPAIVPADFPSLQFRNELSSLTVQALGLVWSNKCSHCCANLLFILRCNPASSKKILGLSPSSCREHNASPCDLV